MAEAERTIGIDTSCYTTSVAAADRSTVSQRKTMLSVPLGSRGLRQSDAVFQHVKNLPELIEGILSECRDCRVRAVGVSSRPTDAEGSYMPVFLVGRLAAVSVAQALGVPLIETTHQAGHIRAALYGNEDLLEKDSLIALHLSGGTTDVLHVEIRNRMPDTIQCIGGSSDLHAGQFVDRVGVRMGLPFPSGQSLEAVARKAQRRDISIPSTVNGSVCSFSGQESYALRLWENGISNEEIAYAVYDCLARTIVKMIKSAAARYPGTPVLLSGGVAGSALLREMLRDRTGLEIRYAREGFSSDNAAGIALIALDRTAE